MLQRKRCKIAMVAALLLLATGCITPRRVNYLQDMTQGSQIELEHSIEARVAPYDELTIVVSTSQIEPELAAPFNNDREGLGYLVDANGNIDFPVLGRLHVAGMTRLQLQDSIASHLQRGGYLDDALVMVRFKNFKIFVLGNGTGRVLNVSNERCTFLEALAMMGGLDNYTRRDRIGVMREVNGRMVIRYLDPRSSRIFHDPFFMMQQNDFIILDGVNANVLRQDMMTWIGVASTLTSTATLIITIFMLRNNN